MAGDPTRSVSTPRPTNRALEGIVFVTENRLIMLIRHAEKPLHPQAARTA